MKTTENTVEKLTNRIPAIHPYDVPEVLALDTSSGHIPYLDWVVSSVEPESNTVSN
jgi:periplasmic divalent cation tolerance protein